MREIQLTQGKVALVDDEDYEWLSQWKWCAKKDYNTFYAVRTERNLDGKKIAVRMHSLIAGKGCDHKDRNGLNNMRQNLRPANDQQQSCNRNKQNNNTSGYKGVSWRKDCRRWQAYIKVDGKQKHLGYYNTPEEAANAYDIAACDLHGEFASLNMNRVAHV